MQEINEERLKRIIESLTNIEIRISSIECMIIVLSRKLEDEEELKILEGLKRVSHEYAGFSSAMMANIFGQCYTNLPESDFKNGNNESSTN